MKIIRQWISICMLFFGGTALWGQDLSCMGHINKPMYVTGEVVWFKVYLPDFLANNPFAVSVTLHGSDGRAIDQFFIKTEGQPSFSGHYKIPYSTDPGLYRLHFSSHSLQVNRDEPLLTIPFPIYNDLRQVPSSLELVDGVPAPSSDAQLQIDMQGSLATRDQQGVVISVKDANGQSVNGDVSISIVDAQLHADLPYQQTVFTGPELDRFDLQKLENSIYVKGKVLHGDEDYPVKLNVFGGYSGTDNRIYYTKSAEDGSFVMKIPDYTGEKPIQFLGYQREEDNIRVVLSTPQLDASTARLLYSAGVLEYMNWSRMRKKIYQHFGSSETPLEETQIVHPVQELEPNATFLMDEYESFETIGDFFNELMSALSFSLNDDSLYQASMYNLSGRIAKNTYLNGPPLFIIDDKATRDADFVARMACSPVETVELFLQPKELLATFQALGISGVARIKTRYSDIIVPESDREDVYRISGLLAKAEFPSLDAATPAQHPVFTPVLSWAEANVADGQLRLQLHSSDDLSKYRIEVVSRAAQGGFARGSSDFSTVPE